MTQKMASEAKSAGAQHRFIGNTAQLFHDPPLRQSIEICYVRFRNGP